MVKALLPEPDSAKYRYVRTAGRQMHYVASEAAGGDMLPVVLVHGVGLSHRYLMPVFEELTKDYRVYAPDLPGFGKSYDPPATLTIEELADRLAEWMAAVDMPAAFLLGNSVGCQVIIHLAVRHPERVRRAVLQGPTVEPGTRTFLRQGLRWRRNNKIEQSRAKALVTYRSYADAGIIRALKTFWYAMEDRPEAHLPGMQCPTLVVRGAKDPIISQDWAETVTRLLPDGRLKILPGLAHTINWMGPLELARVTRPFFDEEHGEGREGMGEKVN